MLPNVNESVYSVPDRIAARKYVNFVPLVVLDVRSVYANVNPAPLRWLAMWLGSTPTNVHNAENALKNVLPKSFISYDGLAAVSILESAAISKMYYTLPASGKK